MPDTLQNANRQPSPGISVVIRALAALAALYICVYPARAFLTARDVSVAAKVLWMAAVALGAARPFAGAALMLVAVPLLPNAPFLSRAIPHGIVQLAVFSQALPMLAANFAGRGSRRPDLLMWTAAIVLAVGVSSVTASYAGDWVASFSLGDFLRQLHLHLSECVLNLPSPELSNRVLALMTLLAGVLAYVVVSRAAARGPGAVIAGYRLIAGAAVPVAVLGCVQFVTGYGLRDMWRAFDPGIVRVNSTFSDPNALGAYLALIVPMMIGLFGATSRLVPRLAWLSAAVLSLVALVMTAGRMAYLASAVGLVAMVLLVIRLDLDRTDAWPVIARWFRRAVVGGLAVVLAGLVIASAISTTLDLRHKDQTSYLRTVLYTLNLRQPIDETLKGRTMMWRRSARMIASSPVFGLGLGTVFRKSTAFDPEEGPRLPRLSAHNTFLNVASETGLVGLVAYLGLLAAAFGTLFRKLTAPAAPSVRWMRAGIAAGLIAYGVSMLSGDRTILAEDLVIFFAVVAIGARLAPPMPHATAAARWVAVAAIALLGVTWPLHARAEMRQINLARHSWGFYEVETDSGHQDFRWTSARAAFYLPATARAVRLPLRSLAPFPQRVIISLDGRPADEVLLRDHNWVLLRYVLPPPHGAFRRVDLQVTPTWLPRGEARTLGVAVGPYSWEP